MDELTDADTGMPPECETEGGRVPNPFDPAWSERFRPTRPVTPLLARLRDAVGPTGSRVGPANAAEVQALATAVIALSLAALLGEGGDHVRP